MGSSNVSVVPVNAPVSVNGRPRFPKTTGPDQRADLRAVNGPSLEVERRDDDHVESVACAQGRKRIWRAAPFVSERGVGCHQETAKLDARADPLDEDVVRRPAQQLVEMLHNGDRHARAGQALQALDRVQQQRRGVPGQHLVGVVVEGDDGRSGVARRGTLDQLLEQVVVAQVEPVKHAHHDEDRTMSGLQTPDPVNDLHRDACVQVPGLWAPGSGVTNTLSGASRPAVALAIATRVPPGSCSR